MMKSALFVQRRVRTSNSNANAWESNAPCIRIPVVVNVDIAQAIPGGYGAASLTIPAAYARYDPEDFRYNTQAWIMDGMNVVYYGYVVRSVPQPDGTIAISMVGAYDLLNRTRMRTVWGDGTLGSDTPAPGSAKSAQLATNSDNTIVLSFPKDHSYKAGQYVAVDYYLFGEASGPRDGKTMDGWDIFIGGNSNFDGNANLEVRIYGLTDPTDDTPNVLQRFTTNPVTRQETSDASFGDNISPWANANGYRLFRIGMWWTADNGTLSQDRQLNINTFRVTTRGRELGLTVDRQTSTLIKDLFNDIGNDYDGHALVQEEHANTTNQAVVGNIPATGQFVSNQNFTAWSSPQEIVEHFAAIDGSVCGMWRPADVYPSNSNVVASGTSLNYWVRQPAELTYTQWGSLSTPDYTVRLQRGAQWAPDAEPDSVIEATYVNYSTRKNRQKSVFVADNVVDNYLYEQGWHEATDWQIDPPVGDSTAASLGTRYTQTRRQPAVSGTLTISSDAVGAIEEAGGARLMKLATVRAGRIVRIVDAKGAQAGRITAVDYVTGTPDVLTLTINDQLSAKLDRRITRLTDQAGRARKR